MIEPPVSRNPVVVAVTAAAGGDYAIELACGLAQSQSGELLGLFVEDADLLEHSFSRRAREVLLTGRVRELDRGALERQLRVQAARVRARFERATARLGRRHRFEVARGNVLVESIRRAAQADALVLTLARSAAGSDAWSRDFSRQLVEARLPLVLLAREGWLTGRSVAVVVTNAAFWKRTAQMAAAISKQSRSPVHLLIPGDGEDPDMASVARQMQQEVLDQGVEYCDVLELGGSGIGAIIGIARACCARLIVMPAPADAAASESINELMRRYSGAVMLVR